MEGMERRGWGREVGMWKFTRTEIKRKEGVGKRIWGSGRERVGGGVFLAKDSLNKGFLSC